MNHDYRVCPALFDEDVSTIIGPFLPSSSCYIFYYMDRLLLRLLLDNQRAERGSLLHTLRMYRSFERDIIRERERDVVSTQYLVTIAVAIRK